MRHADNLDGTFTNPLIFADYPDPDIIRVGDDFYMVSSSFTAVPGIPICHSKDLVNWRIIGHTYQELPRSNPAYSMTNGQVAYRGGSWAPCIRYHEGKFYICFNTPAEGFFMAIAARPEGPYELTAFGFELYDPSLLFDDDGRVYLSHGAGGISVTELTADACAVKSEPISIHQSAFGSPLEGSHFYKRNGFYYICVTSRGYNGLQICLRSANVYGPYRARVLCADDMNYAGAGLHQGGFVDLRNGQSWFFLFQDRDFLGRLPVLQPVRWEDDWPMLGDSDNYGKAFITCPRPEVPGASEIALPEGPDDFDSTTLGLQWHWNHNPDASRWSLSERPGHLRLHAASANDFLHARNTLAQKIVGPESTASVTLETSGLLPGDLAGLAILGIPYAFIAASRTASEGPGLEIVMVNDGAVVASAAAPKATRVHFRCHAGSDGLARFSWSEDGEAFAPLGNALTMQFTVKTFLGNKFALFCYHQQSASHAAGFADFDRFQLDPLKPANVHSAWHPISAVAYDAERGTDTQRITDKYPAQRLIDLNDGDWILFNQIDFGAGTGSAGSFHVVACPSAGGSIEVRKLNSDKTLLGTCVIPSAGITNQWAGEFREFSCSLLPGGALTGIHPIGLFFKGNGRYLMRLESFRFAP